MKIFVAAVLTLSLILIFAPIKYTPADPILLDIINVQVNQSIVYTPDTIDFWQSPAQTTQLGTGDCEDIAILKSSLLPVSYRWNLVLVYSQSQATQHMVLMVDDHFILDNQIEEVYTFDEMPYDLLAILPRNSIKRPEEYTAYGEVLYAREVTR